MRCGLCGGVQGLLGKLGRAEVYSCRNCGMQSTRVPEERPKVQFSTPVTAGRSRSTTIRDGDGR